MHPLLLRQLRRLRVNREQLPSRVLWQALLDRVSSTYVEADQDRYIMERSLAIASREMQALHDEAQRHAETELAQEHQRLIETMAVSRATHEVAPDGILVIGRDKKVLNFNQQFVAIWGIPGSLLATGDDDELIAHVLHLLADPDEFVHRVRYLYDHPTQSSREEIKLVDGRVLERYSAPVLLDQTAECWGRVWFFRDITHQRRTEEELRLLNAQLEARVNEGARALVQAGKLAAVGTVVAGVAHEVNNPLAFVVNNLEFLHDRLVRHPPATLPATDADEIRQALAEIHQGVERVRVIVRDLKTMSRPEPEPQSLVDVERALQSAVAFARAETRQRATVTWRLEQTAPVMANEARLGQVFLNLIVNAAQAMPQRPPSQNEIRIASYMRGHEVVIEVVDNGLGISAEDLPRLFDPFFTTKPPGKGTGLGLSIGHAIVTNLGGRIEVESQLGRGSVFRVTLPAHMTEAPVVVAGPPPAPHSGARGRILVVDDEAPIGRSVSRLLRGEHDVVCASSAGEALLALAGTPAFDVILCDLMMPGTNGIELHAQLDQHSPELARRMVFMTGGAVTATGRAFLERMPERCLEKPCDPTGLRDIVARVIDETRAGAR